MKENHINSKSEYLILVAFVEYWLRTHGYPDEIRWKVNDEYYRVLDEINNQNNLDIYQNYLDGKK